MSELVLHGEVMPEGQLSLFELADIANREHTLARGAFGEMIEHAVRAGEALLAAKAQQRHGEWLPWLEANFDASERTARVYMQVANRQRAADLEAGSLRKALEAISGDTASVRLGTSDSQEWYTPATYIEAARDVLGAIDLDPASTAYANATVQAARFYTAEDDGLKYDWHGRVWLNPPYGREICGAFVAKALAEYQAGRITAVLLLNGFSYDARWFQPLWDQLLCFTYGRITWHREEGQPDGGGMHGSVFAYLGPAGERFAERFSEFGAVVTRWAG